MFYHSRCEVGDVPLGDGEVGTEDDLRRALRAAHRDLAVAADWRTCEPAMLSGDAVVIETPAVAACRR